MTEAPRCYLHVGSPKTGTTYLQSVLWGSKDQVESQGLHLPLRAVGDHFNLTRWLRGQVNPETDSIDEVEIERRLREDLAANPGKNVLISHELLAAADPERVDDLLSLLTGFELHVIVTARDLHRQLPAEWQQHVKTRYVKRYEEFLADVMDGSARHFWKVQDVPAVLRLWGSGLPPERLHVVTVPPRGSDVGELLSRFCSLIGIDPSTVDVSKAAGNPSLGYAQTELLRRVNLALGDELSQPRRAYPETVKVGFAEALLTRQKGRALGVPEGASEWASERSRAMVDELRQMGCSVEGDLEDLVGKPTGEFDLKVPERQVTTAAVEVIAAMLIRSWETRWKGRHGHQTAVAEKWGNRLPRVARDRALRLFRRLRG